MSVSMCEGKIIIDGTEKTRLEASIDAARVLIHDLLDEGDNIYIGIIAFAGQCFRAASLTKNEDYLNESLDLILSYTEETWYGWTDITEALQKAYDSFYIDESDPDYLEHCNRNIVLISDGIPTRAGENKIYREDSDDLILSKLQDVIPENRTCVGSESGNHR